MKKIIQNIHNGKKINESLEGYREMAVPLYSEYASLELTFSAYTLLQEIMEEKKKLAEKENVAIEEILVFLSEISRETADYEKLREKLEKIRERITVKMDLFTAYTDRLIVYEYVLNRLELKFLPEEELAKQLSQIDEEQFLKNLMIYLFSDKDQSIIKDKLRLVIGQVPVHMTKAKWFEKIAEALTLYKGGERSSFDDFIYMLRTSALVYEPAYPGGDYPEVENALAVFSEEDFGKITESRYKELVEMLSKAANDIHEITDLYYSMQKVVNDMYGLAILFCYAKEDSKLIKACKGIWRCLSQREYLDEMLIPLEGRIEPYVEKTSKMESVLYEIKNAYTKEISDSCGIDFFEDFVRVVNLLSDSLFIDLDKVQRDEKADEQYVKERTEILLSEIEAAFETMSRPVRKAIMGQVMEKLPMMFDRTEEVEEYVRTNLLGCQNKTEKLIVMSILSDVIGGGM